MATPAFCSICRRNVRGSYAVHAGTKSHRARLLTHERTRGSHVVGRIAATRRANRGQTMRRNVDRYLAATTARIKTHRRRRPLDGPRKSVKVVPHYRRKPAPTGYRYKVFHQLDGKWWLFGYNDGKATSMRRATRAESVGATEGGRL